MAQATFTVVPLRSTELLPALAALHKAVGGLPAAVMQLQTTFAEANFSGVVNIGSPKLEALISKVLIPIEILRLEVQQQPNSPNKVTYVFTPKEFIGAVTVDAPDGLLAAACNTAAEAFQITSPRDVGRTHIAPLAAEVLRAQEASLAELRAALGSIQTTTLRQQQQTTEFFHELAIKQEERIFALQQEYDAKKSRLDAEFEQQQLALNERSRELQSKEKEFDLRGSMAARRALHAQLEVFLESQSSLKLSDETASKRRPVQLACVALATVGMAVASAFAWAAFRDATPEWHHMVPLSTGLVLIGSTVVYYIRWSDRWLRDHASAEFKNLRLRSDIIRASWLAELFFEGREHGRELPDILVDRFSDGLFREDAAPPVQHPVDQVSELISKLSSIKLGPGPAVEISKTPTKDA